MAIEGALIKDRRHIQYFTGFWPTPHDAALLYVSAEGTSVLAVPERLATGEFAADRCLGVTENRLGTMLQDPYAASFHRIKDVLPTSGRVGTDSPELLWLESPRWRDISPTLLDLRRTKDADEVELVRHAIRGCEAAYARARQILAPGVREIDLYAEMQSAAVKELGVPIEELGNDFQAGTPGGPPRRRAVLAGELMPLDVAVSVRGYRCDLCRTFVVNGQPTSKQQEAALLVLEALRYVEQNAKHGVSGMHLYDEVRGMLSGVHPWTFPHHLGHGTGLNAHESPRLNPHWNDTLQLGDLVAVEPGLYGPDLGGGVRIEDDYWITAGGSTKLSTFPQELVIPDR
ncbi:MAG: aminopeptidase P family protein [Pirellulales bacterium]|nr:aminopeptidase P family protein [Pirellulales bacterium]